MNDEELDRRLDGIRTRTLEPGSEGTLAHLGRRAATGSERPRIAGRVGWGVGLAALAVVLTAGTTATAYYLQVPPFVELPAGSLRTAESIPLDYHTDNGIDIRCRIFLEFAHVDAAGVDAVDEAIRTHDWSDFGQGLYDAQTGLPPAPPLSESLSPQDPVGEAATAAVSTFAATVIPDLAEFPADGDLPLLSGVDTTCVPSAQ
jgi:hypothetical protein